MNKLENISISWESTGYSVLKNLNSTVLGIFCEFIDNSIQSYKNDKSLIHEIDPNFKLKIEIIYDGEEIIIRDNAGGINTKNFERALKPANKPQNTKGLNEFGLGMKYAAVWISNEWELISSSIGENVKRKVIFNYNDVVNKNLHQLPIKEEFAKKDEHFTEVRLRLLEKKHVVPWQSKYLQEKLAFIYRNFVRSTNDEFYNSFLEPQIILNVFGKNLEWNEYGFLKQQWYVDRQEKNITNSPVYEWKHKFDWMSIPIEEEVMDDYGNIKKINSEIEISGFIGILPDGEHKSKNGFVLFRRGRVVEGFENRIFPRSISGNNSRSFKYIRIYGEIHFRNIGISFDKTKLKISRSRKDEIFNIISLLLKKVKFDDGNEFNLISQADKHRANFKIATADEAVKSYISETKDKVKINRKYDEDLIIEDHLNNDFEELKSNFKKKETIEIGDVDYEFETVFTEAGEKLFYLSYDNKSKSATITVNCIHKIFKSNSFKKDTEGTFHIVFNFIKAACVGEIMSLNGTKDPRLVRFGLNDYINQFY